MVVYTMLNDQYIPKKIPATSTARNKQGIRNNYNGSRLNILVRRISQATFLLALFSRATN